MKKFKVIICDDEPIFCAGLEKLVKEYFEDNNINFTIKKCLSGAECIENIEDCNLLFLDIEMPKMDGIEVKERITQINKKIAIVYVTNYTGRMIEAFSPQVFSFIKKPAEKEQIFHVLSTVIQDRKNRHLVEILTLQNQLKYLFIDQILYIKAEHQYTNIVTNTENYIVRKCMHEWHQELARYDFCQIHKSILVNLGFVEKIDTAVTLENGEMLQIAIRRMSETKKVYSQYVKRMARRKIC